MSSTTQLVAQLGGLIGLTPQEQAVLEEGGNHPFHCRCGVCVAYWTLLPPDDNGMYGPFTKDELLTQCKEGLTHEAQ